MSIPGTCEVLRALVEQSLGPGAAEEVMEGSLKDLNHQNSSQKAQILNSPAII